MKEFKEKKDFFRFINNYNGELRVVNCNCYDAKTDELVATMKFPKEFEESGLLNKIISRIKRWLA